MPQSLSMVYLHVVFSTKDRRPFLNNAACRHDIWRFVTGATERLVCPAVTVGGMEDHMHALIRFGREITQADWVREIKRASSVWIKEAHASMHDFHWQSGYAMFSVSASNVDRVVKYIREQEAHHKKQGFQDEWRALLRKHGLEWDERYIWE